MKIRSMMAALLAIIFMICGVAMAETAEPVEVVIWHTFTDAQQTALEGFAAAFNESQDQYEVVVQSQAYSGFEDTVYNAVANGVGPSIIFNYASTAADYIEDDLVVDMSQYINEDPEDAGDLQLPARGHQGRDRRLRRWRHVRPARRHHRPDLLLQQDHLRRDGLHPADDLGGAGRAVQGHLREVRHPPAFAADSLTDLMHMLIMQSGNEYIDMENKCVLFDTDSTREWLQWFADNVQAGYFGLRPTGDYWSDDFNAKLVASYSGSLRGRALHHPRRL